MRLWYIANRTKTQDELIIKPDFQVQMTPTRIPPSRGIAKFNHLRLAMWDIENNAVKHTVGILCRTCLLSGAPRGHLYFSASAVSFIKPQTATWSEQTRNVFTWIRWSTNGSLCVRERGRNSDDGWGGMTMTAGGCVTCGSVVQSWFLVQHLLAFGLKTSSQQTAGEGRSM